MVRAFLHEMSANSASSMPRIFATIPSTFRRFRGWFDGPSCTSFFRSPSGQSVSNMRHSVGMERTMACALCSGILVRCPPREKLDPAWTKFRMHSGGPR
eukprot:scaffold60_cov325-Pavlova_lutheri.AAC.10